MREYFSVTGSLILQRSRIYGCKTKNERLRNRKKRMQCFLLYKKCSCWFLCFTFGNIPKVIRVSKYVKCKSI